MSGPAPGNAPASAQEMAYGAWQHFQTIPPDAINYDRCVWVVTVHAPFTPPHPYGSTGHTYSQYTIAVDAASHMVITIAAAPNPLPSA